MRRLLRRPFERNRYRSEYRTGVFGQMSISDFFTTKLGANLANVYWSWGATNPSTNQVFLRVWEDELETVNGVERSPLWSSEWGGQSNGYAERKRHVDALLEGAEGYGVLCTVKDPTAARRAIAKFDDQHLLKFGEVIVEDGRYYGTVVDRVAVEELARPQSGTATVLPDLKAILRRNLEATEKAALANARIGQGFFRAQVLALWGHRCCVTGTTICDAVRASHIKPWKHSSDSERLDPYNGLPLVATLDALFDVGLITFDQEGTLLVSKLVAPEEKKLLGLVERRLVCPVNANTASYLTYHREKIFR